MLTRGEGFGGWRKLTGCGQADVIHPLLARLPQARPRSPSQAFLSFFHAPVALLFSLWPSYVSEAKALACPCMLPCSFPCLAVIDMLLVPLRLGMQVRLRQLHHAKLLAPDSKCPASSIAIRYLSEAEAVTSGSLSCPCCPALSMAARHLSEAEALLVANLLSTDALLLPSPLGI